MTRRSPRELELEDKLADVLTGFGHWLDNKSSKASTDQDDECLIRWVQAGPAGEELSGV